MSLFRKAPVPPARLPAGSFTVDPEGNIVVSTLPSSFPVSLIEECGRHVLATFREAQAADLPLLELVIRYAGLKITARELRGGAIVFLLPQPPPDAATPPPAL